jgi:hypothetical protein
MSNINVRKVMVRTMRISVSIAYFIC